jgi:hypothetical protein
MCGNRAQIFQGFAAFGSGVYDAGFAGEAVVLVTVMGHHGVSSACAAATLVMTSKEMTVKALLIALNPFLESNAATKLDRDEQRRSARIAFCAVSI